MLYSIDLGVNVFGIRPPTVRDVTRDIHKIALLLAGRADIGRGRQIHRITAIVALPDRHSSYSFLSAKKLHKRLPKSKQTRLIHRPANYIYCRTQRQVSPHHKLSFQHNLIELSYPGPIKKNNSAVGKFIPHP